MATTTGSGRDDHFVDNEELQRYRARCRELEEIQQRLETDLLDARAHCQDLEAGERRRERDLRELERRRDKEVRELSEVLKVQEAENKKLVEQQQRATEARRRSDSTRKSQVLNEEQLRREVSEVREELAQLVSQRDRLQEVLRQNNIVVDDRGQPFCQGHDGREATTASVSSSSLFCAADSKARAVLQLRCFALRKALAASSVRHDNSEAASANEAFGKPADEVQERQRRNLDLLSPAGVRRIGSLQLERCNAAFSTDEGPLPCPETPSEARTTPCLSPHQQIAEKQPLQAPSASTTKADQDSSRRAAQLTQLTQLAQRALDTVENTVDSDATADDAEGDEHLVRDAARFERLLHKSDQVRMRLGF